jgi:hypothetical protein
MPRQLYAEGTCSETGSGGAGVVELATVPYCVHLQQGLRLPR